MDRRTMLGAGLGLALSGAPVMAGGDEAAIRGVYERFLEAQNARDLVAVRATLLDSPDFVWISDGKAFWGPDTLVQRMAAFQAAEVWHVVPDRARARVVDLGPVGAFLFQPLALSLGPKADPRTIAFLVNVLCVRTDAGWRIAGLFTTEENPA